MLTLSEANNLNFDIITLGEIEFLYRRRGFVAVISDGKLTGFEYER